MRRAFWLALLFTQFAVAGKVFAQGGYNPYAAQKDEPPISADGKLNWSTFYKSAALEARYQQLWQMGSCRGTNMRIEIPVQQNKLDINKLPEGELQGHVVKVGPGMLTMIDKEKHVTTVVLHPAGVTHVEISGPMAASSLKKGMNVRFEAKVDERGRSEDPLVKLDVITLPHPFKPTAIKPNSLGTIVGQVIDIHNKLLRVRVQSGAITRVILPLDENAVANLEASDVTLTAPGDAIEVKGHLWDGEGSKNGPAVFASEVVLKRPLSPSTEMISLLQAR